MSVIGEQIKKYRIEKGITQEQLGQMIGVTTQGVSRWERGGTPDAEILPRLSEILGVSIDTLFGREEQSLAMSLARRLSQMEEEEAYHYAFNICWAIELGLMGNNSVFEDFVNKFLDPTVLNEDKKLDYFAKNIHENGMANLRMSPDLNHFFLLLQPKGNLKDQLCDRESLRKVFAAFADDKLLRIILYVYSFPYMPIATSLISKNVGLSLQETDLETLEDRIVFLADHIISQFSRDPVLLRFISKNLSWGIFKSQILAAGDEDEGSLPAIIDEAFRSSKVRYKNPEVMIFMIIELLSSCCYSSILYQDPLPIEALKPYLFDSIRSIMRQQEIIPTAE